MILYKDDVNNVYFDHKGMKQIVLARGTLTGSCVGQLRGTSFSNLNYHFLKDKPALPDFWHTPEFPKGSILNAFTKLITGVKGTYGAYVVVTDKNYRWLYYDGKEVCFILSSDNDISSVRVTPKTGIPDSFIHLLYWYFGGEASTLMGEDNVLLVASGFFIVGKSSKLLMTPEGYRVNQGEDAEGNNGREKKRLAFLDSLRD